MVPVHLVPKPAQPEQRPALPDDALCYLVGSDGVFKQVKNEFYSVRVRVGGVAGLAEIGETATLRVPKLPLDLMRQVESFFAAAYKEHHSEAVVLLLANPTTQRWKIEVPPQWVRGLHVSYDLADLPEPPEGFRRFGTIHSHAGAKAFHSGTDDADEASFDGLHITIGNVDQPVRSYSARWMLAGKPFPVSLSEVVESMPLPEANPAWLAQVRADEPRSLGELFPPDACSALGFEDFATPDEYRAYLEEVRDEVDERLQEAALLEKGR